MVNEELKPCQLCGRKPIIEHWQSGGLMYMVKCNNPDCLVPVESYPTGHNLDEVITEWNRRTNNVVIAAKSAPTAYDPDKEECL